MDNVILMPGQFLSTLSLRRATAADEKAAVEAEFLSTLSLRRATQRSRSLLCVQDFYPRSPCGERPVVAVLRHDLTLISIHALLAESDPGPGGAGLATGYFYPRSPCGERRSGSTNGGQTRTNFYPRSPCGERRTFAAPSYMSREISIHALLAESDIAPSCPAVGERSFLSTLSLRRATV